MEHAPAAVLLFYLARAIALGHSDYPYRASAADYRRHRTLFKSAIRQKGSTKKYTPKGLDSLPLLANDGLI